jgi:beta-xylosidase
MQSNSRKEAVAAGQWIPDLGNGMYQNPILYADYSDPDIVRFGDDFFMTASSFNCTPGLPLLHSKDLVNWAIVNHICGNIPLLGYEKPLHGKGIWAPTLKVHDGKIWLYVCTPDEGLFMTCTDNPFEKWPEFTHVIKVTGWIDPCAFWDDDGQAYLLHAFAKSRVGICSLLHLCRMSPDGTQILDEGRMVIDANGRHHAMEGPRIFKRDGFYYISAPAGGIEHGYQVVMRSRDIYGPYDEKIAIHEGTNDINGPRQGGYVDLDCGESWFAHFQDMGAYGRVVNLEPVVWNEGWPIIGEDVNGDGIGEPVKIYKKPDVGQKYSTQIPQTSEHFDGNSPGLQWQWHANNQPDWYRASKDGLRLYAKPVLKPGETLFEAPNLLLQKFAAPVFTARAKLCYRFENNGDLCGLMISGLTYYYLAVERDNDTCKLNAVKGFEENGVRTEQVFAQKILQQADEGAIVLQVEVKNGNCTFAYSQGGGELIHISTAFEATPGRWIGAKAGIFCLNKNGQAGGGYADYEAFDII